VVKALPSLLRRELVNSVRFAKGKRVGLALSGGVDSCSILAACTLAGVEPVVLSYTPATHESTDYRYAADNAAMLGLPFLPVRVDMGPDNLERLARFVIMRGYRTKMQVESLAPMVAIAEVAHRHNIHYLLTGDQADGYYINSNWFSRNYDRAHGVPGPERHPVREDADAKRIDELRDLYWEEDRGNCEAVSRMLEDFSIMGVMPYRNRKIAAAFRGKHWREVNLPRLKEPVWQAFEDCMSMTSGRDIAVRRVPVNLHRGDSRFADTLGKTLHTKYPQYKTPLGVYGGIARGEI
jgi:asparagine synthetase B (glutamine-hydrolysing)